MKPILFNTKMVKAILSGEKTCTRRVVKKKGWDITGRPKWCEESKEDWFLFYVCKEKKPESVETSTCHLLKPPYEVGDVLYVRETWRNVCAVQKRWLNGEDFTCEEHFGVQYKADEKIKFNDCFDEINDEFNSFDYTFDNRWKPSIHMPRQVARIFLRVTDVRVEELQAISYEQAEQEGCWCDENGLAMPIDKFIEVWDSTIKDSEIDKYGWNANPYVWVIEFEVCDKQEE